MYTEEQFTELEQEERDLTDEAILLMLLIIANLRGNLEKELRNFYQMYGKDGVVTWAEVRKWVGKQDRRRRFVALLAVLNDEFQLAKLDIRQEFETMLRKVVGKEVEFFDTPVDEDKTISTPWGSDERTWDERLDKDIALWIAVIAAELKQCILRRMPIDDVLLRLDKRFNSIESVLQTLGISESTAVGSEARRSIFKALGITKYQFFSRPDERRCDICGELHGKIFPMSAYEVGVTASPIHARCRCWEVPITE